jgi:hypothetical protein
MHGGVDGLRPRLSVPWEVENEFSVLEGVRLSGPDEGGSAERRRHFSQFARSSRSQRTFCTSLLLSNELDGRVTQMT